MCSGSASEGKFESSEDKLSIQITDVWLNGTNYISIGPKLCKCMCLDAMGKLNYLTINPPPKDSKDFEIWLQIINFIEL